MKKQADVSLNASASNDMIKSVFTDMKKFTKFYDFLVSVGAMEKNGSRYVALQYNLDDIGLYTQKFVNKHSTGSLNDNFIFEDKAIIYKTDESGNKRKSGYFLPMDFWNYILNSIKFENRHK